MFFICKLMFLTSMLRSFRSAFFFFLYFYSPPNPRGGRSSPNVITVSSFDGDWWPRFIKFGQKFGDPPKNLAAKLSKYQNCGNFTT